MTKLYLDTETTGLTGDCKLIQYAIDDSEIKLIKLFNTKDNSLICNKLQELHNLLYSKNTLLIGYNLNFDIFHLYKIFHRYFYSEQDYSIERPVKPFQCNYLDLYLHALRESAFAPFAFSRITSSIARLNKIPIAIEEEVKSIVNKELKKILVEGIELHCHKHEEKQKGLVSLSWTINPKIKLKTLIKYYYPNENILQLDNFWDFVPNEKEHLPYKDDPMTYGNADLKNEIIMKDQQSPFYTYAINDIRYLRMLEKSLCYPKSDYNDTCAGIVSYTRYHGFPLDQEILRAVKSNYINKIKESEKILSGINPRSSKQRLELLKQYNPAIQSSSKEVLHAIKKDLKKYIDELDDKEKQLLKLINAILGYGSYKQKLDQVEKLLESRTERGHPNFKVIGTASGRMSGTGGLNWQGITGSKKELSVRDAVLTSMGGDFSSLEISIAAAVYEDAQLQRDLNEGIDLHSMTAVTVMPEHGYSYEEFKKLKKTDNAVNALRQKGKTLNFAMLYGCTATKVKDILECSLEEAEKAIEKFFERYNGLGNYRKKVEGAFCTADTEKWTKDSASKMADSITDILGNTRFWTFEKNICKLFWRLGQEKTYFGTDGIVTRVASKGEQSYTNAFKSACLGASIGIQQSIARQAGNHLIQAVGAGLTKKLMEKLWIENKIPMMNIHDEIQIPAGYEDRFDEIKNIVDSFVKENQKIIPSLAMDFEKTKKWSEK